MANQLKMATVNAMLTLKQLDWSQRRIAEKLGIDRETMARYVHSLLTEANPAMNPIPGSGAVGMDAPPLASSPSPTLRHLTDI